MNLMNAIKVIAEVLTVILLVIIFFNLSFLLHRSDSSVNELKEYWEQYGFRPDTTHIEVDYEKLPKPVFKFNVPPAQVSYYKDTFQIHQVVQNDSLLYVIDSLQRIINVLNLRFITNYTDKPKLLYAEFSADSIKLDIFEPRGTVLSKVYGVNYNRFRYQYLEGSFRATEIPQVSSRTFSHSIYTYAGFDVLGRRPALQIESNLDYGPIRLGVQGTLSEHSAILGRIGYKIR